MDSDVPVQRFQIKAPAGIMFSLQSDMNCMKR